MVGRRLATLPAGDGTYPAGPIPTILRPGLVGLRPLTSVDDPTHLSGADWRQRAWHSKPAASFPVGRRCAPLDLRPLVLEYQEDPTVYGVDLEYLLGSELLVAPVFEAGATERRVYLPAGRWHDFWTDCEYQGQRWVTVQAPLE